MENILQEEFFNNTVQDYLIIVAVILFGFIFKRFISKYVAGVFFKLIAKANANISKQSFCDLVVQPLEIFLLFLVSFIAIDKLNFPEILEFTVFKITSKLIIDCISIGTLIIVFIWLCLRLIDFAATVLEEKANNTIDKTTNQLIVFFKDFFKVILVLIGVLLLLRFSFHRNIGNLLTGLSLVGAAVALATRESLENLIASFIIFFDKPFVTGDLVKVLNFTGTVEKIGLRSTRIRTDSKTYITVPNKQMVDSILDNITLRTQRKVEIKLELRLTTTVDGIKQLIANIKNILQHQNTIEESTVYLQETGKNAHIVLIEFFTTMSQDMAAFFTLRENINLSIIAALQELKIELASANTDIKVYNTK